VSTATQGPAVLPQPSGRAADEAYLAAIGERLREIRARRGMSRRILARASGVSERYLASLESGRGNASILLLKQIAQAMDVPVEELARSGPETSAEVALLTQWLSRLSAPEFRRASETLHRAFGERTNARRRRIALIGLRGAGKTTLGSKLAIRRNVPFIELDREIERLSGMSLAALFDLYGQSAYRRYERRALESVIESHEAAVIATGGSLVSEPATFDLLLSACFTVWLKARPEEHMSRVMAQGDFRPMAENDAAMEDLRRILDGRAQLYSKADVTVDTAGHSLAASLRALKVAVAAEPAS
jgi:XRE family aerobic/anaerobic benzoate catabolism transcriptional regulator